LEKNIRRTKKYDQSINIRKQDIIKRIMKSMKR